MWDKLSNEWQTAFEEAWVAFRNGSTPIGAAIFDENGICLVREHNRNAENDTLNKRIAHAEANALRRLDTSVCDVGNVVLYATMEPCPMCMGTAVMSNIKHLRYAARDPHCGCVHWKDDDPYISSKKLDFTYNGGVHELVQLVIQSYYELRWAERGHSDHVLQKFQILNSTAVDIARALYKNKTLDEYAHADTGFSQVFDTVASMVQTSG